MRAPHLVASVVSSMALLSPTARADFVAVSWDGDTYRIDPATGVATLQGNSGHTQLNSMATDPTGRVVSANNGNTEVPHLYYVDPVLGKAYVFALPFLNSIRALAFNPAGVLYAIDSPAAGSYDLYTLDLSVPFGDSSIKHFVGHSNFQGLQSLEFASDGTLYSYDTGFGLVTLDPTTAQGTDVNGLQDGTSAIQTLAFAPDGTLYGAGDGFYSIDLVTGAVTTIGSPLPASVRGMGWVETTPATPFCFGDGTGAVCPCANSGAQGHGCNNSSATGGSVLVATGTASLSADTLQLTASGERPTAFSVFLQGRAAIGPVLYGDGLRCTGVALKRLRTENAVAGTAVYPDGVEQAVAARSAVLGDPLSSGNTRFYQVVYRDPDPVFCPAPDGSTFNSSQGLAIVWAP